MGMEKAPQDVRLAAITGGMSLGGSSTFLLNLARALGRTGETLPIVVLDSFLGYASEFRAVGNPVHTLPFPHPIYEDRLRLGYQRLARHRPQAVLSCLGSESFEMLRLVPPGVTRLGIVQSHEPGPYTILRQYAPYLDGVVGVSHEIQKELSGIPELDRARVEYIPYGIDFTEPAPPRSFDPAQPLRLIYLGRLIEEQKRVSRLIELARLLDRKRVNVQFSIVGAGPEEESLRRELTGLKWVRFTGVVPNKQACAFLRESDVFVLLSDYEGLPLSLLEAMGQGVVPVVSDLPSGMREVVSDACGFRVPLGDVPAAAAVISNLANNRSGLHNRSDQSIQVAREHYSAELMASRYLALVSALKHGTVKWPDDCEVPPPLGLKPWLYSGVMRKVRRKLKPWLRRA
jgi:glycosyltransferase involved in cell wall biosynthesis